MNSTEARAAQLERLRRHYEAEIAECNEALEKWRMKFADNPLFAFEWSLGAIGSAASLIVAEEILGAIDGGVATRKTILKHAEKRVMTGALYPPQSTSPTSNLAAQYKTAAWANAVELLSGNSLSSPVFD
jgi:hypothetical protein